ncbi:MAG: 4-hydroxythreonine-4-phosphate dehydrogenase PdxA [Pseudomonadota bacterium]
MTLEKPLALTLGEPGGIGPEITLALWHGRKSNPIPPFVWVADPQFIESRAARLGFSPQIALWSPDLSAEETAALFETAIPITPLKAEITDEPGVARAVNGAGVMGSIEQAVDLVHAGHASAVVTNPIHKKSLYEAGFTHPGHTEFLGVLAERWGGGPFTPVMMLAGPELRTVPATLHIPLKDVPDALDPGALERLIETTHHALVQRFGVEDPVIVVAGLNPHAGEEGTMGHEDDAIIAPAVHAARLKNIHVTGPHPADTLFYQQRRESYDAAIAMYHDQALLPVKTLAFDETVNVTLGLPFIRTSPDHGTALDIAGRSVARPDSLRAALSMAAHMVRVETASAT